MPAQDTKSTPAHRAVLSHNIEWTGVLVFIVGCFPFY